MRAIKRQDGYVVVHIPGHPHAGARGLVREHLVVASAALGRPLPVGAQVHHVNGDPSDNRPQNLVICQDAKYHKLLHVRARIVRAGGNPDTDRICSKCRVVKHASGFYGVTPGVHGRGTGGRECRACANARTKRTNSDGRRNEYYKQRYLRMKAERAAQQQETGQ